MMLTNAFCFVLLLCPGIVKEAIEKKKQWMRENEKEKQKRNQNVDMLVYLFAVFSCATPFPTSDCLCMYMNVIYQKIIKKKKVE